MDRQLQKEGENATNGPPFGPLVAPGQSKGSRRRFKIDGTDIPGGATKQGLILRLLNIYLFVSTKIIFSLKTGIERPPGSQSM